MINKIIGLITVTMVSGLVSAATITANINLPEAPAETARLAFSIYGYDVFLADASASLIKTEYRVISNKSQDVKIHISGDMYKHIDQDHGPVSQKDAAYYVVMAIDLNKDGKICKGDLDQSYKENKDDFFNKIKDMNLKFTMVKRKVDFCNEI